jgi:hypothetical protein
MRRLTLISATGDPPRKAGTARRTRFDNWLSAAPGGMACHGGGALAFLFAHDLRANAPRLSRGKTAAQFFRIMR